MKKKEVIPKSVNFTALIFTLLLVMQVGLAEENNLTDYELSVICINESKQIMENLLSENFSIQRVNDTIREAENLLESQLVLEERGQRTDYSRILSSCETVSWINSIAFDLRDQILALEDFYDSLSSGIETQEINESFEAVYREMNNERYENVEDLIEKTYNEISLAEARQSTLNVFYDATTRGLKRFLSERWPEIVVSIIVLIFLIIFLRKPIEKAILNSKLRKIEIRKRSLKDMISRNQDDYFNKGKISEEAFTIRNKKLAELIRDVDRLISIYREQIHTLETGASLKSKSEKDKKVVSSNKSKTTKKVSKKKSKR